MMTSLEGKIALITGSSRGIGRAIALELARQGADVVVNYRNRAQDAEAVVNEVAGIGRRAIAVQANMADPADIERLFQMVVEAFGGLDILVCNAATGYIGDIMQQTVKTWDLTMNVNVRAVFLCAQAAFPIMSKRGGGRIVVLTSPGSRRAIPQYAAVGVSKAAVNALVIYLAVEFAPYGITVNAVSPGPCDTEALRYYSSLMDTIEATEAITPAGRLVTPEDVAHVVAFLSSDKATMICGEVITVDGGLFRLSPVAQKKVLNG
jgi:enoyl-[acyl-carrier protein] reductase III